VVVTFDPIGGYRHPDHIHVHNATVMAFEKADKASFHPAAGGPFRPRALYFQVFPRGFLKWMTRLMPLIGRDRLKWGRNGDIDLRQLAEGGFSVNVRLDIRKVAEIKRRRVSNMPSPGWHPNAHGLMGMAIRIFWRE